MSDPKVTTELIVLRKTPYHETSLIISGLSPEFGKLDFLVKGAKQISKKKFPVVDLFRELQLDFNPNKESLQSIYNVELLTAFDTIVEFPDHFRQMGDIATFILRNAQPMLPAEDLYQALRNALDHLSREKSSFPWGSAVRLAFLSEHGLLPDYPDNSKQSQAQARLLDRMLDVVLNDASPPDFPADYWTEMSNWIQSVCRYHEI